MQHRVRPVSLEAILECGRSFYPHKILDCVNKVDSRIDPIHMHKNMVQSKQLGRRLYMGAAISKHLLVTLPKMKQSIRLFVSL
jgi:hypothetical protein